MFYLINHCFLLVVNMSECDLLSNVTLVIRTFLCKLHGITDDHNYEPMLHTLFYGGRSNLQSNANEQDTVNLVWILLEELRNILATSNMFPKRVEYWMDSVRSTRDASMQTDMVNELTDSRFVQVTCTNEEFSRRIHSFLKRKQAQADAFNRREFCKIHDDPDAITCARTDAVFVPRQSKKSLLRVDRVNNSPNKKETTPIKLDKLESWPPTHPSNWLPFSNVPRDIKERLSNLQDVVMPNKCSENSNVYDLLRKLEKKLLYLETLSPEYFEFSNKRSIGIKRARVLQTNESLVPDLGEGSSDKNQNLHLLENRIDELKTRLTQAKKIKNEHSEMH